jgi:PmbA protein
MADELLRLAQDVLSRGAGLPGDLEVYAQHSLSTTVKVYAGSVESLVTGEPRGVGVRYVVEGHRGYAYTGDLSPQALDQVVAQAAANAVASDADSHVGLPDPPLGYPEVPGLWRPGLGETSIERKIGLALEAERVALAASEIETVEESVYSDLAGREAIVSSRGVQAYGEQTFCYVYVSAHARRGDDVQTALGFEAGREPVDIDAAAAGRDAAARAAGLLGAAPCASERMTVVFDREVAAAVLSVVSQALSAEAVQKGRSLFEGRIGTQVAAVDFSLADDGLHPGGMATSSFDDEGVPRRRTSLVEQGMLRSFLHDTYTARKQGEGTVSTGNASRGSYRGAPGVAPSNLVVDNGMGSLDELFGRVGRGLYVVGITGLHSGANPVSGEFSVGATGHLIEGGARGRPVREITIASDLLALLANVRDRAGDARWVPFYGSVLTPSLAIADVTVSGT